MPGGVAGSQDARASAGHRRVITAHFQLECRHSGLDHAHRSTALVGPAYSLRLGWPAISTWAARRESRSGSHVGAAFDPCNMRDTQKNGARVGRRAE
jgi:hypothetical protein